MKRSLLFALILLSGGLIFGQQYSFSSFSLEEGLAQSQVRSMTSDSQGNIWVGTLGGVSRFDGREFENYTKFSGLFDDHANTIIELSDKSIAVGSVGGVSIINAEGIKNFPLEENFKNTFVNHLLELKDGSLLVSTYDGVFKLKNGQFQLIPETNDRVSFTADYNSSGDLILCLDNAVMKLEDNQLIPLYSLSESRSKIYDLTILDDQSMLLATSASGLYHLDQYEVIDTINVSDGLISNRIRHLFTDHKGQIWCGSENGVSVIREGSISNFTEDNGLPANDIRCIHSDFNGNIWLGTEVKGIARFTSENILNYTTKDGLSSNLIMSIAGDDQQGLVIGTYDSGALLLKNGEIERIILDANIPDIRIWNIAETNDSRFLFATDNGLYIYNNPTDIEHISAADGLNSNRLKCIYSDNSGRLWIGSNGGVNIIHGDSLFSFDFPESYGITKTRGIIQDQNNTYWFASRQGLVKYNDGDFELISSENGLMDNSIYDLEVDAKNRLWVATRNGLNIIDNGEISNIQLDKNPLSNHINFVKEIDDHLVMGTNSGMYILNHLEGDMESIESAFHLSNQQGLMGTEMNQNAVYLDPKQHLWVGSTEGLSQIKSIHELVEKQPAPRMILDAVKLNLEDVNWFARKDSVSLVSGLPIEPTVNHQENHFTFNYRGLSFNDPENISFRYKLHGFDDQWQPVTADLLATYSNLDYKSYKFEIQCKSTNSDWSESTFFSFTITPPFWRTWWFYILSSLAFVAIIYGIMHRRKKILLTEHQKEKFEFESKMRELEQQSLNSSMNRHFIFNSLNSIQYYINRKDRVSANKYLSSFAKLIRKNLDSSQKNTTYLRDELDRLSLYIELEQMRFKDKFEFNLDLSPDVNIDEVKVPSMLLQPFLENSIWHGLLPKNEKGKIELSIFREGPDLNILIEDDGIGIEQSLKKKEGKVSHDSRGMDITKGRIDLIKMNSQSSVNLIGPQEVTNEDGEVTGTRVRIILPENLDQIYGE